MRTKKLQETTKFLYQSIKKREKKYLENFDTKTISDNKTFWKTVKPLLSNKFRFPVNVALVKENDIISDNGTIADVFNNFFTNVKNLNITVSGDILCEARKINGTLLFFHEL